MFKSDRHVTRAANVYLLHMNRQGQVTRNNSANTSGNTTTKVNTYCSFKGKPTNHILLSTAFATRYKFYQYIPCRVVLDSASQLNFITERCVQRKRLARTQTPAY
jgi:hypothetical protein